MVTKTLDNDEMMSVDELSTLKEDAPKEKKKKHPALKFFLYFLFIIIATALALFLSLYQDFNGVITSLSKVDYRYFLLILGLVLFSYMVEAFVFFVFSRLYTRNYYYHQGLATTAVGAFYGAITPSASGGQVMRVYTMKKQGIETSNAASIMIMAFIVYEFALTTMGAVSLFFSAGELISSVGTFNIPLGSGRVFKIPAIPLTIIGLSVNVIVILGLFLMSYSHKFHNFIMHHGIDLVAKLKLLKNPEKTRETLRIQVENFKLELRRLLSNIPVMILIYICYLIILITRYSIPFFAGIALDGFGYCLNIDGTLVTKNIVDASGNVIGIAPVMSTGSYNIQSFWRAVFLGSYHSMAVSIIPIPGAAGIAEYFFNTIFQNYYVSKQVTSAAQIIWRFSTYHLVLLVCGIVAATYRSSPKGEIHHVDRHTFVTMQLETYELRKASADTMFETASLSRKEIQARLAGFGKKNRTVGNDDIEVEKEEPIKEKKAKSIKPIKTPKRKPQVEEEEVWDSINAGED